MRVARIWSWETSSLLHPQAAALVVAALALTWKCEGLSAQSAQVDALERGFAQPPLSARPLTWWHWINGNVTKEGIEADLTEMKKAGLGGAQMLDVSIYLPPGPVRYGSDLWHEHVQHAIRTANKLGLEFHIMNCPGWSASGGPWNKPEGSMKQFTWSETEVDGGRPVDVVLPLPPSKLGFYRDVAVIAVPAASETTAPAEELKAAPQLKAVIPYALSTSAHAVSMEKVFVLSGLPGFEGQFRCDLPEGKWALLRFGFTSTGSKNHPAVPEGHGLECDKMDPSAAEFQFEKALGRIIREAGPLVGKTFKSILFDSFEGGYQNWTDRMPEYFQKLKGYKIQPFLPVLTGRTVGSRERSESFLRDFQRVVNELIAKNYFGVMQRLAHSKGLTVYAEAQGGPLNPFLCNEYVDVPMNEFWMPDAAPRFHLMKHIASISGLLGQDFTGAEAFTAKPEDGRWIATLGSLKFPGDCAFTAGINRFILHTWAHQPYSHLAPGFTLGRYGTHFGRQNTWWPYAGAWVGYVSRSQFLLQQGRTVADVCFVSDEDLGVFLPSGSVVVPPGYDYEVSYARHLGKLSWTNRCLTSANGTAFRLLVLPEDWHPEPAHSALLEKWATAGVPMMGPMPMKPKPASLKRTTPAAIGQKLKELSVDPDFSHTVVPSDASVRYIHRRAVGTEIYFVANQSERPIVLQASFRVSNLWPELWDPVTGRMAPAASFTAKDGRVGLPIALNAFGSIFVIFRKPLPAKWVESIRSQSGDILANRAPLPGADDGGLTTQGIDEWSIAFNTGASQAWKAGGMPAAINVPGPWEVTFSRNQVPAAQVRMGTLQSWAEHSDPAIRYYSGTAAYRTSIELPSGPAQKNVRRVLDLGRVCDVAEVKVNGKTAAVLWTPPFRADVTKFVKPGRNEIEILVANRWVNRLIGDEQLPEDLKYSMEGSKFTIGRLAALPDWLANPEQFASRQRKTFATWRFYDKASPLLESGLLGPVTMQAEALLPAMAE